MTGPALTLAAVLAALVVLVGPATLLLLLWKAGR